MSKLTRQQLEKALLDAQHEAIMQQGIINGMEITLEENRVELERHRNSATAILRQLDQVDDERKTLLRVLDRVTK